MKLQIVFLILVVYFLGTNGNKSTVFKLSDKSEQGFFLILFFNENNIYLDYLYVIVDNPEFFEKLKSGSKLDLDLKSGFNPDFNFFRNTDYQP